MQTAPPLSAVGSGSVSTESGTEDPVDRDLLYMHELAGGRGYSKLPATSQERARRLRGMRRHVLQTRCGGDEKKLASDLAIYGSVNGPAKLRRIWRERGEAEMGADGATNEVVTIH